MAKYIDVKIAKFARFSGLRQNVGMDIYNVLNADGVTAYNFTTTRTSRPAIHD